MSNMSTLKRRMRTRLCNDNLALCTLLNVQANSQFGGESPLTSLPQAYKEQVTQQSLDQTDGIQDKVPYNSAILCCTLGTEASSDG